MQRMALRVLPEDVRSILSASAQINNFKTAIAELVYNSLDAGSTSIAIRVHIQENSIQVIDNGYGITKNDFDALGQRYMTSKLTDMSTLTSMPTCYGYRGEFLANIIQISRNVKIISRHQDGEETWAKAFHKGKMKQLAKMTTRPSKGTTVEIKEFLYNLNIQKRGIDPVNELQNIKSFLEQLSIAHNGISLSLRDDSKNDIIFKIHKKRDVYQTMFILFDIGKPMFQELQIEKNQYKIKAFIGKTDIDLRRHWIYVNGRYLPNIPKVHKIINEYLKKYLLIKYKRISKSKNNHDEDDLFRQNIPFYFVFITCPYIDYDLNLSSKQSIVEFKNWKQIKIMLEKLVKFYTGDISVKENCKAEPKVTTKQSKDKNNGETEDKIKNIIRKILGSNSKKLGVSQLQNGVKGKLIKRKRKKKNTDAKQQKYMVEKRQDCSADNRHNNNSNKNILVPRENRGKILNTTSKCIDYNTNTTGIENYNNVANLNNYDEAFASKNNHISKNETTKNLDFIVPNNQITPQKIKNKNVRKSKIKSKSKVMKSHIRKIKPKSDSEFVNYSSHTPRFQLLRETNINPKRICRNIPQRVEECQLDPRNCHMVQKKYNSNMNIKCKLPMPQYHTNCKMMNMQQQNTYRYNLENYVKRRIKFNPYKTTYDLVQTIMVSQPEKRFYQTNCSPDSYFREYPSFGYRLHKISQDISKYKTPLVPKALKMYTVSEHTNSFHERQSSCTTMSKNLQSNTLYKNIAHFNEVDHMYHYNYTLGKSIPIEKDYQSLRCEDIYKERSDILYTNTGRSRYLSSMPVDSKLTYESHKYSEYVTNYTDKLHSNKIQETLLNKMHSTRFITKESRDNFSPIVKYRSLFKSTLKPRNQKKYNNRTDNYNKQIKQTVDKSYTIEFTKSSDIRCPVQYNEILVSNQSDFRICFTNNNTQTSFQTFSPNYEPTMGFGNTYIIPTSTLSAGCNVFDSHDRAKYSSSNKLLVTNTVYYSNSEKSIYRSEHVINKSESHEDHDEANIIFLSEPEHSLNEQIRDNNILPLEICEIVLSTDDEEKCYSHTKDCSNKGFDISKSEQIINKMYVTQVIERNNEDASHHFSRTLTTKDLNVIDDIEAKFNGNNNLEFNTLQNNNSEFNNNDNNFDLKDRLRFLPKGMSQIFEKCGSKAMCNYNLDEEYYENVIYNDFANDVQMHADVYEPVIQHAEDFTTKDINKFENKVQKENTSLVFDKKSLKRAMILNQIDCKFIAAIIKEGNRVSGKCLEYLVLFDQHAVHERIRLEQNLADYFDENGWKSVPLDNVMLKMTKDEMVYLHNYREKFNQLGLQWTMTDKDEILVNCIPEAILGKNPREVDKVIKAIKNLVVEEIGAIKLQKGCISIYPKSIMDLVFSEACRYAIKFGDKLSKNNCIDLLNDLSKCNTPFQCAHGRPVMAVLVDVNIDNIRDYKVDAASIKRFKLRRMTK